MSRKSLKHLTKSLNCMLYFQKYITEYSNKGIGASMNGLRFDFTQEQKELRNSALKFSQDKIIPSAAHYDRTADFPWPILEAAHANGLMNCTIPPKYGGLGLDPISQIILYEKLGYGCTGCTLPIVITEIAYIPLLIAGSEEQKNKYLRRLMEKPIVASFAVTEPEGGSDVANIKTSAVKDGNDYIINGNKMWISNGGHANFYFVLTRTDANPETPTSKAFTAFIVDGDTPGIIKNRKEDLMGQRASDTRGVTFENVRVPASNVVGRLGEGFVIAMKAFDESRFASYRPYVAALANGITARCLDEATNYALERKAFDKPIYENQGISFMLVDMAKNLELSRLITFKCAYEIMMGRADSYFSSIAKCFAADTANSAAADAVEIFGGNGQSKDYPVEKLMRDAKVLQTYEGTRQIQRVIISRRIVDRVREAGLASLSY